MRVHISGCAVDEGLLPCIIAAVAPCLEVTAILLALQPSKAGLSRIAQPGITIGIQQVYNAWAGSCHLLFAIGSVDILLHDK